MGCKPVHLDPIFHPRKKPESQLSFFQAALEKDMKHVTETKLVWMY